MSESRVSGWGGVVIESPGKVHQTIGQAGSVWLFHVECHKCHWSFSSHFLNLRFTCAEAPPGLSARLRRRVSENHLPDPAQPVLRSDPTKVESERPAPDLSLPRVPSRRAVRQCFAPA